MQRARNRTARKFEQHWLDFGTNKYKPYALQGGATDLHMPFVVQVLLPWQATQSILTWRTNAMLLRWLCHLYMLLC